MDGQYLFEIGGPRKNFEQIKDIPDSFLAIDGIEFGRPLFSLLKLSYNMF